MKTTRFHPSRETFITIFLILVLVLALLPFMATFNDILTRIVINLKGYWFIRDIIVPFEVKMVGAILTLLSSISWLFFFWSRLNLPLGFWFYSNTPRGA